MNDHLRDQDFLKLARLLEGHTGIQLPPTKRVMIEGRLRKRAKAMGLAKLETYGRRLFEDGLLEGEFELLVDCTTTNKTDFFREPDHFDFLRDRAVPALLDLNGRPEPTLKIWSAACSIGAEAYTIAMVLAAMQEAGGRFHMSILGTDICTAVLEQARVAVYTKAMTDVVPAELRRRYVMEACDPARDETRIVPGLRRLASFQHLNLMDETYRFPRDFDVIFCRNVLIYFARPVQQAVLRRLGSHLRPGGYLILGHSESFAVDDSLSMQQVLPTVFRRASVASAKQRAA